VVDWRRDALAPANFLAPHKPVADVGDDAVGAPAATNGVAIAI
jgi:hypothetical protein